MQRRSFLAASLATGACALHGCAQPGAKSGKVKRFARPRDARNIDHAVVYRKENEFAAWPYTQGLFETGDGVLLGNFLRMQVNYQDAATLDHEALLRGPAQLVTVRSRDRGRTWDGDAPQVIAGGATGEHDGLGESIADLGPVDFTDGDTLVWSQCTASGTPDSRPYVRISKDAGRNWSRLYRLPLDGQPAVSANSSQLVRADGRSMMFLTAITENGWTRRPMVYLSTADRSTWRFLSFITPKEDPFGATDGNWPGLAPSPSFGGHRWFHPRGLALASGRILCTLRCQRSAQDDMWSELYYSDDGGVTWGFRSRINDFGAPTSLVAMQDGRLVAVYGYRLPPYGVRASVSHDEGRSWEPEVVVRGDGGSWDLGYPQAVESTRGSVMALYYFNSRGETVNAGGGVRHIARSIFTPD
jgi:hypothetical protein